jgi:DNA polymerase type B, organellar and viral
MFSIGTPGVRQWGTHTVDDDRLSFVSTADYADRRQRRLATFAKYRGTHKDYRTNHHGPNDRGKKRQVRELKRSELPFIMWDGEGPQDTGYSLFGNSEGYEVCYPSLSTWDCLEIITQTGREHPDAIHIAFGFNYDASMIIKDLPRHTQRALDYWGKCRWKFWTIEHLPHKWFKVTYRTLNERITVKIFDIRTFFQGAYVPVLKKFNIGTEEEIALLSSGKASRPNFMWAEIGEIAEYMRLELRLGVALGEKLRESLYKANYLPTSWHGPGALARMALKRHRVYDAMAKCPAKVRYAARMAYAGGRFDQYIIGEIRDTIYEKDINSAYPYYATQLPNLRRGNWRFGTGYEPGKFALYHIRYEAAADPTRVYPLFRRTKDYSVKFPNRVEGWYWAPEASLVVNDPDATFIQSIVFDEFDPTDRPFAFLADYYRQRKMLDKTGNIAGYAYKILINAMYGQLAQRAGWDRNKRTAPRSHQLEWAGYITSACRAAVYRAAVACGDKLISINTDSVQALCPIPEDVAPSGNQLGDWESSEYLGGLFWQAGIYTLQEDLGYAPDLDYGWNKAKTRGIPKGQYTTDELREAIHSGNPLVLVRKMFVTYSLALMGQWERRNTWNAEPHAYKFGGSDGKRIHLSPKEWTDDCLPLCRSLPIGMHRTINHIIGLDPVNLMSTPHYLPWIEAPNRIKQQIDGYMIDLDELDPEEWKTEYDDAA